MKTILISVTCAVASLAFLLAACGDGDKDADAPKVVATTGIVADIATQVAGPDVEVEQLIPGGASPHDFQLSAEDRARLEEADLVVANGTGLEAGIPLEDLAVPVWELAAGSGELLPDDPHVWMDPLRVAAAVPSLADELGKVDPAGKEEFARRSSEYAAELEALDRDLNRDLAAVAPADRELVTSHDSLGYFADRYGFEVVATAFPASGPEAEISAGGLQKVIDAVGRAGVPTVFAGEEDDPEALRQVAEATGVEIEEGLAIESLGDAGSYLEMLRRDAGLIAAGLSGPQ
jgi:zinc/manganese transport system substrate-binding protein